MANRPHGRYAEVDTSYPRAWATCDACGCNINHYKLSFQRQWQGFKIINLGTLVCPDCLDRPAEFLRTIVLPPDPPPLYNIRPEPYSVDDEGPTQPIIATLEISSSSVAVLYLDLFDGDPSDGGTSVLDTLAGSATRTNFASSMGPVSSLTSINTAAITLVTNAITSANVTWLAAYDAATAGNLLGATAVVPQTVVMGNGLAFAIGALTVRVQP